MPKQIGGIPETFVMIFRFPGKFLSPKIDFSNWFASIPISQYLSVQNNVMCYEISLHNKVKINLHFLNSSN